MKSLFNLTKEQISILKSVGIIMIVLHNFLHWRTDVGENEMSYSPEHLINLMKSISNDPFSIFIGLFSYFGHFGVQIFIFVSAYGLTKKYLNQNRDINYKEYIGYRLIKIYSLAGFGLLVTVAYQMLYFGPSFSFVLSAVKSLTMTNNFRYASIYAYVGPWWFFSLILQLYFVFPFLYRYLQKKREMGFYLLLAISYLSIYVIFPFTEKLKIPLFGNFLGHLPEFLLGIALAMFPKLALKSKHILMALGIFVISNLSEHTFPFSFLSATVLLIAMVRPLLFARKTVVSRALVFIGGISMFIFLINGQLRTFTLEIFVPNPIISPAHTYMWAMIHLAAAIIVSYGLSIVYNKTILPLSEKLYKMLLMNMKDKQKT
ncbi:MAG: acyltransferase [Flavobacteriaceae bacterium]|jgi:peptidoglycan/LPS O-acetylase OafA/YrhL|nr:acyltransferase [Flavobacteriaceae bacterium]